MKNSLNLSFVLLLSMFMFGCIPENFIDESNKAFGDQHFKSAIQIIELHHIRAGEYPETLNDVKYLGDWDHIIFSSVTYKKLDVGYELNLTNGWMGAPKELEYPDDFWNGLGLVKSNLKK